VSVAVEHPEGDVLAAYARHLRARGLAATTLFAYLEILGQLARLTDPLTATRSDLEQLMDRPRLSVATRRAYLSRLRAFYTWAMLGDLVEADPTRGITRPRQPRHLPRPMTAEQVSAAIVRLPRPQRTWVMLAAYAGLRCCEISAVAGAHVLHQRTGWQLLIPAGKGGHAALVPVHPQLLDELRSYDTAGPLWPDVNAARISMKGARSLRRVGLDVTMHQARHYFGTTVYRVSGRDLRLTQELMRHASPATTAIYTQVDDTEAAAVIAALPALL
jgi:site-specific recombinase XerC